MGWCSVCWRPYNKFTGLHCGCGHYEGPRFGGSFRSAESNAVLGVGCALLSAVAIAIAVVVFAVGFVLAILMYIGEWTGYAMLFPVGLVSMTVLFSAALVAAIATRENNGGRALATLIIVFVVVGACMLFAFGSGSVSSLAAAPLHADRTRLAHFGRLRSPSERERAAADQARYRIAGEEWRYALAGRLRRFIHPSTTKAVSNVRH
jgi:hypothetical protein